jgi:hypothetical protein
MSPPGALLFPITINGITLGLGAKAAVKSDAAYASNSKYILIQSRELLTSSQRRELSGMDLILHKYVSRNTYLYHHREIDLDKIRQLEYVVYVDVYRQEYKVASSLLKTTGNGGEPYSLISHLVDIVFHENVDVTSEIKSLIAAKAHIDEKTLRFDLCKVRLTVREQ